MELTNFGLYKMSKKELSPKMVMVLNALNDDQFNPSEIEERLINQALIYGYIN